MIDERDLFERAAARFDPPLDALERLTVRRDRKRRNQRIGAAGLALVLAVAAIGGAISIFRAGERTTPGAASITPENVGDLGLAWTGQTYHVAGQRGRTPEPVVHDGVVYAVSDALYAFPAACGLDGGPCEPLWRSEQGSRGHEFGGQWAWPPAFDGDRVFVTTYYGDGSETGAVFAYDASCRSDGGVCSPAWSASVTDVGAPPTVANGSVFVGSWNSGRVSVFDEACGSGGSSCEPAWIVDLGQGVDDAPPLAMDGVLYVTGGQTLFAIPDACPSAECSPLWTTGQLAPGGMGVSSRVTVADGRIYMTIDGGTRSGSGVVTIEVFREGCWTRALACRPLFSYTTPGHFVSAPVVQGRDFVVDLGDRRRSLMEFRWVRGQYHFQVSNEEQSPLVLAALGDTPQSVGDGVVFAAGGNGHEIYAFPVDCGGKFGAVCSPIWTGDTTGQIRSAPAVSGDSVFVGTGDGKVVAFRVGAAEMPEGRTWTVPLAVVIALVVAAVAVVALRRRTRRGGRVSA